MNFPYLISIDQTGDLASRWESNEGQPDVGRRYAIFHWGRHQQPENRDLSGWQNDADARRVLSYHHYRLGVGSGDLALDGVYGSFCFTYPEEELTDFEQRVLWQLRSSGWKQAGRKTDYRKGDLDISINRVGVHPQDEEASRSFPADYATLEVVVKSGGYTDYEQAKETPWQVELSGIRPRDNRGMEITKIEKLEELLPYLPAQLELGCGPSVEAGIPALHYLHNIYRVADSKTKRFILDLKRHDVLDRLIRLPEKFFRQACFIHKRIFLAKPTLFYRVLKSLHGAGVFVGGILNNNFDRLPNLLGLPEECVRRFGINRFPDVSFDSRAKSLIALGVHADRRGVQRKERSQGLQVVYIDPEGFIEDGNFSSYPLEGPQDGDIVWNATAEQFALELSSYFEPA